MSIPWGSLLVLALLAVSVFVLLPAPPHKPSPTPASSSARGVPYETPGPILASRIDSLNLDGLTIIPVTHVPSIKGTLQLPFIPYDVRLFLDISTSELVFSRFRVRTASFRAKDATREPMEVQGEDVGVKMKGSVGIRVRVEIERRPESGEDRRASNVRNQARIRGWSWRSSGRVEANVEHASFGMSLQLVRPPSPSDASSPRLSVLSTALSPGLIDSLLLDGFTPFGRPLTVLVPYVRSTPLVNYPVQLVGDYLIREFVEGRPVDELLAGLDSFLGKHVDGEMYGGIVDAEREDELKTPLDAGSLVPPDPSPSAPSTPLITSPAPPTSTHAPSPSTVPSATPLRFHAHLLGPTHLHSFTLPDLSPELYRSDGRGFRNALQNLNVFTSEFKLLISRSSLKSITFERASVAFDPPTPGASSPPRGVGVRGGDLVLTVAPFTCTLESSFSLTADVKNPVLSWASGLDAVGEKGTSTTSVLADSLEIRLRLSKAHSGRRGSPIVLGVEEDAAAPGGGGVRGKKEGKAVRISKFTSVESRVELRSKLGKMLGDKVVNRLLEALKTQLAQAASLLIAHFLADLACDRLQEVLDEVDEKLRIEGGVEWGWSSIPTPEPGAEKQEGEMSGVAAS
ncbi:hypothetical protein JCM1840_007580 [Sporobolomyces johnsonii]